MHFQFPSKCLRVFSTSIPSNRNPRRTPICRFSAEFDRLSNNAPRSCCLSLLKKVSAMNSPLIWGAIIVSYLILGAQSAVDTGIQNKNVDRTIDLTSQNVKVSYKITLVHKNKQPIAAYEFLVPQAQRDSLAFISIRDSAKKELKYIESNGAKGTTFAVSLPAASAASAASQVLYIDTVFTKSVHAFPTEIVQNEKQLVRYFGSAHFYSPYLTLTQKTTIHLASKNVESYTTVKPSSQSEATLTYGPYDNIAGRIMKFK